MSSKVNIRVEGTRVLLIEDGTLIFDVSWEQALEVAAAIKYQAERIREIVHPDQAIRDQAILQASGAPFGITNNPDIQQEAIKVARYELGGVKSKGIVGTPTVRQR